MQSAIWKSAEIFGRHNVRGPSAVVRRGGSSAALGSGHSRGADPRARAKRERLRGTLRAIDQGRVPRPADSARGAALPSRGGRVRRALSRRTESPGPRQSAHRGPAGHRPDQSRTAARAARRAPQLLRAGGVIVGSAQQWNITGFKRVRTIAPPRGASPDRTSAGVSGGESPEPSPFARNWRAPWLRTAYRYCLNPGVLI